MIKFLNFCCVLNHQILHYQVLQTCVKEMVARKSFDGVISALTYSSYTSSQAAMFALIDRWMDTTHSFHIPFGEINITPLDFIAITGLSFFGEPIRMSNEAHSFVVVRNRWPEDLFGATTAVKFGCFSLVRYT